MTPEHIRKKLIEWVEANPSIMIKKSASCPEWWYAQNLLGNILGWPRWYEELIEEVWLKYRK